MPLRILMIDDNEDDLLFTRIALTRCGVDYDVRSFQKAQDALDHLSNTADHGVDLILLDINMPVMNGFDFLEAFEALAPRQRGNTVVVLLSSSRDALDRERATRFASVRGFLTKPLERTAAADLPALIPG
ncbi:response regulator [Hydrogenophaga sp.]|uniref:response regulator n=1 Tax=Hydrogenophaga sp. TaxID=1904254 RepID=UPI00271F0F26|nr:response regulator [Hydrogenophaga sp.]MDO8904978.1 response regulator [Hydrogenophaga sp.]